MSTRARPADQAGLFGDQPRPESDALAIAQNSAPGTASAGAPLAVRLRPTTLDEVVGQRHLTGDGTPLRRLVEDDATTSLLLWGPPGTGKTTLAYVVAAATERVWRELSAVTAGVKDVRAIIDEAAATLRATGRRTVLFVDEVHRFSKTQQDALLPAVERGTVTLVAATTENPFFSVVGPLLSRSLLLTLEPLTDHDIEAVIARALRDPRGYDEKLALDAEALAHLVRLAGGDARKALTMLESAGGAALAAGKSTLDLATLERAVDRAALRYDRDGDQHYDVISAFIKSVRGSDADAALHYLARMISAGEDPRFIARRLIVLASEDIGLADPTALGVAVAAGTALEMVGLPEARLALAQATVHLSLAPKSNAVIAGYDTAAADVRSGNFSPVPNHLRDKHYPGAAKLGHGDGYLYPHDFPAALVEQQYPPDLLVGRDYYVPTDHGVEAAVSKRVVTVRQALRGEHASDPAAGGQTGTGFRPRCTPEPPAFSPEPPACRPEGPALEDTI